MDHNWKFVVLSTKLQVRIWMFQIILDLSEAIVHFSELRTALGFILVVNDTCPQPAPACTA